MAPTVRARWETVRAPLATASGMVERFNGGIEEVLRSHHFQSGEELETTLYRYVRLHNQQLPQFSPRQQDALAGYEGLARTQTGAVQEAAILPAGM